MKMGHVNIVVILMKFWFFFLLLLSLRVHCTVRFEWGKMEKKCVFVVFFTPSTDFDNQVNVVVSILKWMKAIYEEVLNKTVEIRNTVWINLYENECNSVHAFARIFLESGLEKSWNYWWNVQASYAPFFLFFFNKAVLEGLTSKICVCVCM